MLDPRGVISSGGTDVIARHKLYSDELALLTKLNLHSFLIHTVNTKNMNSLSRNRFTFVNYISKTTYNPFLFAFRSFKIIKSKEINLRLIIAGDPWESYWSAYFLSKFLNKKIPIQIQVHGDIADCKWRRINYRNRIKYSLAKLSLPKASSVRAVTKYQAENLLNTFRIMREKIIVVPVPITIPSRAVALKSVRPKTIGLIGRIHKDRGIWEFLQLINVLNSSSKDFKVCVVGDGPCKDKFLLKLESVITKNRIIYLGQLPKSELSKVWKRIGVLVSMAPVESYGRVMRESLIAGVPVWATASAGVKDVMDNCKKGEVKLLDLCKNDASINKDFKTLLKTEVSSDFRIKFIKENSTYSAKVANSWINIINKSK